MPVHDRTSPRRIGLLGGSFNPAHGGHREISLAALDRLRLDAVWWLVTPGNPLKDPADYAAYEDRLHRARMVADHEDIVVSDFEKRRGLQYTVDTLEQIRDANPSALFAWLMGADSLAGFHRWKGWRRIVEIAPIAVFNRPGYGEDALAGEAGETLAPFRLNNERDDLLTADPPAWVFFDDLDNELSSTAIRNANR